jgi:hypothetical protein
VADQVLPITQLDQVGVILDTPAAALPPNAFTDVSNVRFRDGAVRKMEGEVNIFPNLFDDSSNLIGDTPANFDGSILKYVVWWPNPNIITSNLGYYLVIAEETRLLSDDSIPEEGNTDPTHQRDIAYLVSVDGTSKVQKGIFEDTDLGNWQHTFFQGGFALIINNGIDIPHYILDENNNVDINTVPDFAELPGWDSYEVNQLVLRDTFDPVTNSYIFDLGQNVDFSINKIIVERINSSAPSTVVTLTASGDTGNPTDPNNEEFSAPDISGLTTSPWTTSDEYEIYYDPSTNTTVLNLPNNLSSSGTDTVTIRIESRDPVYVRCGVIRSFGDFLVAGNLVERNAEDLDSPVIRNLNGVVRTSDAAAPGAIPNNWNPFAAGVSTADEFVVADTGVVQDMLEMQGNLYIYTNTSISVMRLTGNASVPVTVNPVSNKHGCQATGTVTEFNGQHLVVGSQDIYVFGGNPSSIQSVGDQRVRTHLFRNLNPLNSSRMFILKYSQKDEIWICYPNLQSITGDCNDSLVWNYRNNVWTERQLRGVVSGDIGPIPGGGLPFTSVELSGESGSNGVTNVGAYEVRTIGIDNTVTFNGNITFYTGGSTDLIYDTGRNGDTTRVEEGGVRNFYEDKTYPTLNITGPEGASYSFELSNPNTNIYDDVDADEIMDQIETQLSELDDWSFDTLPAGYSQLTGSNRLFAATTLRKVASTIPFTATVSDEGNTLSGVGFDINFQESTDVASVHGITKDNSNDYRGEYILRSTPTYLALSIRSETQPGGEELIIVKAGDDVDYDVTTHTGTTNGTTGGTNEETAEAWIQALSLASPTIRVEDEGIDGEFSIQPASFSDLADFVLDVRINDTEENAQWIWDKYQDALAGNIGLNVNSVTPYVNGVDETETQTLAVHSTAPAIAGSLDTQLSPDPLRVPNRTTTETTATMEATVDINNIFDVDRPWASGEINPNLEFPIFASKRIVSNEGQNYTINKVIGADVGWTIPAFNYTPRTETVDSDNFTVVVTNNDEPTPYESYVERKQLAITPEFDVETIGRIAMWASGEYAPTVNSENVYNRFQIRLKGTNNPGQSVDLSQIGTDTKHSTFYISENYKADTRVTGRYINYRITDVVLDDDNNELERVSNHRYDNSVLYSQASPWEVSGMQPEIGKGGGR